MCKHGSATYNCHVSQEKESKIEPFAQIKLHFIVTKGWLSQPLPWVATISVGVRGGQPSHQTF